MVCFNIRRIPDSLLLLCWFFSLSILQSHSYVLNKTVTRVANCEATHEFTDDKTQSAFCKGNKIAHSFKCKGDYCDDHVMLCCDYILDDGTAAKKINSNCEWTREKPYRHTLPRGKFVVGAHCRGRYCDFPRYYSCPFENIFRDPGNRGHNYFQYSDENWNGGFKGCAGTSALGRLDFSGRFADNEHWDCFQVLQTTSGCDRCNKDVWSGPRYARNDPIGYLDCTDVGAMSGNVAACKAHSDSINAHGFNMNSAGTECYIKKCDGDERRYMPTDTNYIVYEKVPDFSQNCDRAQPGCEQHNLKKCTSNRYNFECIKCKPKHTLLPNKTCKSCLAAVPNCITPHASQCHKDGTYLTCTQCASFYHLDPTNKCQACPGVIDGCAIASTNRCETCHSCKPGYKLTDDRTLCIKCDLRKGPNCLSIASNTCSRHQGAFWAVCTKCAVGSKLDTINDSCELCNKEAPNCLEEKENTCSIRGYYPTCSRCAPGYYLDASNDCQFCNEPNPNCQSTIMECSTLRNSRQCNLCDNGYFLDEVNDCQRCSADAPNCITPSSLCSEKGNFRLCDTCEPGFKVDIPVLAVGYDKQTYFNTFHLTGCPNNALSHVAYWSTLSDFGRGDMTANCNHAKDGTDSLAERELCCGTGVVCQPGACTYQETMSMAGDCKSCSLAAPNCNIPIPSTCSELPNIFYPQCSQCDQGFKLFGVGECRQCTDDNSNCEVVVPNSCSATNTTYYHPICETCEQGYRKFDDECKVCDQPTPNCTTTLGNDCSILGYFLQCQTCDPGFYLNENNDCPACDLPSPNCDVVLPDTCSQKGNFRQCKVCSAGYKLDAEQDCKLCDEPVPNCILPLDDTCTEKADDLFYKQCKICDVGYKIEGLNECRRCDGVNANCAIEIPNTCTRREGFYHPICEECEIGYTEFHVDDCKICDHTAPNCTITHPECSDNGYYLQCDECFLGFYADAALDCKPCDNPSPNCTEIIADTCSEKGNFRTCSACVPGYKLDSYRDCVECASLGPNCTANVVDTCTEREGLFYGLCDACDDGFKINATSECQRCDGISNKCTKSTEFSCTPTEGGFYPECVSCEIGWNIFNHDCRICNEPTPYCQQTLEECSGSKFYLQCKVCNEGFYVDENNDCQPCDLPSPGCTAIINGTCSERGNYRSCTSCSDGFKLVDGDCIPCDILIPNCAENIENTCAEREGIFYGKCQSCNDGYKLNATSECQRCNGYNNKCNSTVDFSCSSTENAYYPICDTCEVGWNNIGDDCRVCDEISVNCKTTLKECTKDGYYLQCDICDDGFYLDELRNCKPCDLPSPGCITTIPDTCSEKGNFRTCSSCVQGSKLDEVNDCIVCDALAPNCNSNVELSCSEKEFVFYGQCEVCQQGYKLTDSAECQICNGINSNCNITIDNTCSSTEGAFVPICQTCDVGYNKFNDDCKECIEPQPSCLGSIGKTCVEDGYLQKCYVCTSDHYLDRESTSGICIPKVPCPDCLNGGVCDYTNGQCACPSSHFGEVCEKCSNKEKACKSVFESNECQPDGVLAKCQTCFPGYGLDPDNTCYALGSGCADGTRELCFECFHDEAFKIGPDCLCRGGCPDLTKCEDNPNCEIEDDKKCKGSNGVIFFTSCRECKPGYYPDINGQCQACSKPALSRCPAEARVECSTTGYICAEGRCETNYYNLGEASCQKCSDKGNCLGSYVNECSPDGSIVTCDLDSCLSGFYNTYDNAECEPYEAAEAAGFCNNVALVQNKNNEVEIICRGGDCHYGYSNLNRPGTCTQYLSCIKDECTKEGDMAANCTVIDGLEYECECSYTHEFIDGSCHEKKICDRGECKVPGAICTPFDEFDYTCGCPNFYFFDSVTCESCPKNCISCSEKGFCDSCDRGFFLRDGTECVPANECNNYTFADYVTRKCIDCSPLCNTCYGELDSNCITCRDSWENSSVVQSGDTCYLSNLSDDDNDSFIGTSWFWVIIAISLFLLLLLLLLLVIFFCRRRRRNKKRDDAHMKLPEGVSAMDFVMGRKLSTSGTVGSQGATYAAAGPPVGGRKFSTMLSHMLGSREAGPSDPENLEMIAKSATATSEENAYDYQSGAYEYNHMLESDNHSIYEYNTIREATPSEHDYETAEDGEDADYDYQPTENSGLL